jgi:hypothetical protein
LKKTLGTKKHRVAYGGGVCLFFFLNCLKRHTVEILDATDERQNQLKSIMDRNSIEEFMENSQLAGKTVFFLYVRDIILLV